MLNPSYRLIYNKYGRQFLNSCLSSPDKCSVSTVVSLIQQQDMCTTTNFEYSYPWETLLKNLQMKNPPDLIYRLQVSLKDLYSTSPVYINVQVKKYCENCDGKGIPRELLSICSMCDGSGQAKLPSYISTSIYQNRCEQCRGCGEIPLPPYTICNVCKGDGYSCSQSTITLTLNLNSILSKNPLKIKSKGHECIK